MKATEMLKKINTLLGLRVDLEELVLDNGTRIFADSYDKGESVFIVTDEDERVPLPAGEYMIDDGRMLIVKSDGMIDEVRLESIPEAEEEGYKDGIADEKEDEKEKMEEEVVVEVPDEVAPEMAEIIAAVVEVVAPIIEEVKVEIEELKRKYGEVDKVKENTLFLGRDSKYNLSSSTSGFGSSLSIIVDCHLTRADKVGISTVR